MRLSTGYCVNTRSWAALAAALLSSAPLDAQYAGRFREVEIRFLASCQNGSEVTHTEVVRSAQGSTSFSYACAGSPGQLTVGWSVPETTPSMPVPGGMLESPMTLAFTATAQWTSPPSPPAQAPPYRLTVATGLCLGNCCGRSERTGLPAGTHSLSAEKSCTTQFLDEGAITSVNGGFSATAWGGISYTGAVRYDVAAASGADVSVAIGGTNAREDLVTRVVVKNGGPAAADGVVAAVEWTSLNQRGVLVPDPACTIDLAHPRVWKLRCPVGSLAAGSERALVFTTDVPADYPGYDRFTFAAEASAATADPQPDNNSRTATFQLKDCSQEGVWRCPFLYLACEAVSSRRQEGGLGGLLRRVVEPLAEALDVVPLYRLRDELLSRSTAGRRATELFTAHAAEVAALVATNASFRSQLLSAYGLWEPGVVKLVEGEGSATVVTQAQVDALSGVLASLKSLGSAELRGAVLREEPLLGLATLAGKSLTDGLAGWEATAPARVTVPASASIHGVAPAFFHSDLRVFNPSSTATAGVTARFRCFTGPCPTTTERTFSVRPREMSVYDDVLVSLFAAPETAGAVELDGPVLAESRVYTPTKPAPTTGADVPGLGADEAHAEAVLLSLSHSADGSRGFRTNVGVFNPNDAATAATFTLHAPSGALLGEVSRPVGARAAVQVSGVFTEAGVAADVPDAYAVVKADGVLPLFAYATVIDNQSQDSVFVKGRNGRGADPGSQTVPAAASIHGAPPAFFHSDLRLFNPSASVAAAVTVRFRCFVGACPAVLEQTLQVAPREMKVLDDVLAGLFGAPETAGPLEVVGGVHADSRVYTPGRPAPTAGTAIPGVPIASALDTGILLSLSHSPDRSRGFRTNLGVANGDAVERGVTISLHRADGAPLGTLTRTVPPASSVQVDNVFALAGVATDVADAYAIVTGPPGALLFPYATVIDNQSQDSVFVGARPLP